MFLHHILLLYLDYYTELFSPGVKKKNKWAPIEIKFVIYFSILTNLLAWGRSNGCLSTKILLTNNIPYFKKRKRPVYLSSDKISHQPLSTESRLRTIYSHRSVKIWSKMTKKVWEFDDRYSYKVTMSEDIECNNLNEQAYYNNNTTIIQWQQW